MNILALSRDKSACDYHRITNPVKYLPRIEAAVGSEDLDIYDFAFKERHVLRETHFQGRDIVYFSRLPGYPMDMLLDLRRKYKNMRFVMDIDDYWKLYPKHKNFEEWTRNNVTQALIAWLREADLVITTNSRLQEEVVEYNNDVVVLPNALPFGLEQFSQEKGNMSCDRVRFVYAGGTSHYWDLKDIEEVFLKCRGDGALQIGAQFIIAGYEHGEPYWEKIYNLINQSKLAIYRGRYALNSYMNCYINADVAIAPLENNKFNTYKSTIKIAEAGCKKMPIICSNIWPYLEDEQMHGKGLILCKNQSDWMDAFKFFVKNPEKIKEYGDALYEYTFKKYNLAVVNQDRYKILKDII